MGKWMAILVGLLFMAGTVALLLMPWVRDQFLAFVVGGGLVTLFLIGVGLAAYGYGEVRAGEVEPVVPTAPPESGEETPTLQEPSDTGSTPT